MLNNFVPAWMQDLAGAAATVRFIDIVNSSLFPLALLIPVAIVAVLLLDRSGTSGADRAQPGQRPAAFASRRPLERAFTGYAPSGWAGPALRERPAPETPLLDTRDFDRAPVQPEPPPEPPLVLVADDSAVVRAKLSRLLTGAGFRVLDVSDGQQAFDHMQSGLIPSVLITDLEMPTMDGFELIAAVSGALETEHVPIVAITANEDLQARVADLSGVYGIFKKPWNDRALVQRVHALAGVAQSRLNAR